MCTIGHQSVISAKRKVRDFELEPRWLHEPPMQSGVRQGLQGRRGGGADVEAALTGRGGGAGVEAALTGRGLGQARGGAVETERTE